MNRKRRRGGWPLVAAWLGVLVTWTSASDLDPIRGLPPIRAYALEDIGYVAKGARLSFDPFGRIAVIYEGTYAVLNDTTWINLADDENVREHVMLNVVQGADQRIYFGARETWGVVEVTQEGRWRTASLAPADPPEWTQVAIFEDVLATRRGVCFASWNGVVYWDFASRQSRYFPIRGLSCVFAIDDRAYVGSLDQPVFFIDVDRGELQPLAVDGRGEIVIEHAAALGPGRALLAEAEGRMWVFDGRTLEPWVPQEGAVRGPVSVLQGLVDGGVAVGVVGRGLFIYDAAGALQLGLDLPPYYRINAMANREPGVLWVATEETVEKIHYGSPLRAFGQRLGLTATWPLVARWHGRLFVASDGRLFEATSGGAGLTSRFEPVPIQPPAGAWALAARGDQLLVGSDLGVFAMQQDGGFAPVLETGELPRLVMVGDDLCFCICATRIDVLRWRDGAWTVEASQTPGLAYTPVAHGTDRAAWIEMGGGGVARVWLEDGAIRVRIFQNDAWTATNWVNVGVVGDIVILTAAQGGRRFFSETTGDWCEAPVLAELLDRPARWLLRARNGPDGVIWATHNEGVVAFTPGEGGYVMDTVSFDSINDRYPMVHILGRDDVWISAARSLHRLEAGRPASGWVPDRPVLVSIFDAHTDTELVPVDRPSAGTFRVPYAQDGLVFRFFAGGYRWRRIPAYEYRFAADDDWTRLTSGSSLGFNGLREGEYALQVRVADPMTPSAAITTVAFEVRPPWHRTAGAYSAYGLALLALIAGALRWSGHVERRRNRLLEGLVQERTRQLEATMERLGEETRHAATLAERNRLAGEIHDSLQQGLSGAILQLDSTLTLSTVPSEMRSRLQVIRNMVSYARQEVQHAVWDMESPLAEGVDLGEALRRLVRFIDSCRAQLDVQVDGDPFTISRFAKHHLLRVAQEAVANAARHASASRISIRLEYAAETITLAIADDGSGFDAPAALRASDGRFGLRGIRGRVRKLDGRLAIESQPGAGTTLRVVVLRRAAEETSV